MSVMSEDAGLTWVESGGGPLLVLDRRDLDRWAGFSSLTEPTDYDRACLIRDYVGLVPIGAGHGLVLADMPMPTAWLPDPDGGGGILVRGMTGEGEEVVCLLARLGRVAWAATGLALPAPTGRLLLFDSAYPGADPGEHLAIVVRPGRYGVETGHLASDEAELVLHRLRPVDAGAERR